MDNIWQKVINQHRNGIAILISEDYTFRQNALLQLKMNTA